VEHVKWFESLNEGDNAIKFIVVFDDGTLYIYFKEAANSPDKSEKKEEHPNPKQIIRIPVESAKDVSNASIDGEQ